MPTQKTHTLKSGPAELEISPALGCQTLSWKIKDTELIYLDPDYQAKWPKLNLWGNPILFPSPGLCQIGEEQGIWKHQEKIHTIDFHGFGDKIPWALESLSDTSITCSLAHSPHTLDQYPFEFFARQTLTLTKDSLVIDFEVTNHSILPMPYGVGWHPYFKKPRSPEGNILDWHVTMPSSELWTSELDNSHWQEATIKTSDRFGIGNVLLYPSDQALTLFTDIPGGGRLEIIPENFGSADKPMAWVVWNIGPEADYLCVEPWTCPPNVLNRPEEQILISPGQISKQRLTYRWIV